MNDNSVELKAVRQAYIYSYISYSRSYWTITHGHLRTNHNHSFFTPVQNARNRQKAGSLFYTNTIANIPAKTVNN